MQEFMHWANASLGVGAIALWTVVAAALAMAGGAMAGMWLAGKDLGQPLAAMMGAMFGPVAAVPGILLGLIILSLL